jgi:hypothetical protein
MKQIFYPALIAFGIATLCLLAVVGPLISPSHTVIFHTSEPALSLFATVLFDLFALWVVITAALLLSKRPGRAQFMVRSAIVFALPLILLKNISMLAGFMLPHWLSVSVFCLSLAAFVTLSIFWRPSFLPAFQRVQRFLAFIFGFAALNGIFIVGQLLWYGWQVRTLNAPIALHQRSVDSARSTAGPRVIWILLDELSYQQVYEQRFPGLKLPAFDAIAQQSTVFTHVVPTGEYTEEIIPSLMTGVPVDSIRVSSDGRRLSLHDSINRSWQLFDPHQTVFQDALNDGYTTAVAGWYNPYCRTLPQVLDRCIWSSQFLNAGDIVGGESLANNLRNQMAYGIREIQSLVPGLHMISPLPALETELHIKDYLDLRAATDRTLADPDASFIFLHLPIPHPTGIYDRRKDILTTGQSSYVDNLVLADKYLAHVRDLLQQRGEWDSSAVVIMGDHSWRTSFVWSKMEGWTPEDEAASHGAQFDDRPAYLVKLPQQQQGSRIDAPLKAIHTRSLLDALIAGQLSTVDDLDGWAKRQK